MKVFIIFLFLLIPTFQYSQDIDLRYENRGNDVLLYVNNPYSCPVSLKLKLVLKNMTSDMGTKSKVFVLPARSSNQLLTQLSSINPRKDGNYQTDYETVYGDVTIKSAPTDHVYELPYARGTKQYVHQGYNGRYSHRGVDAIDFNMKSGTKIFAARGGTVIKVEIRNSKGCPSPNCHKYNNMIVIHHIDGTLAVYSHLKRNGSKLKVGDQVETGEYIGLSGATGYASGSHLHFMVLVPRFKENKTIKTRFNTLHSGAAYLDEKKTYTRPY